MFLLFDYCKDNTHNFNQYTIIFCQKQGSPQYFMKLYKYRSSNSSTGIGFEK